MIETGGQVRVIGSQRAPLSAITGTLDEQVIATYIVPAGLIRPRDMLSIVTLWNMPTNAGAKNLRIKMGAVGALTEIWTTSRTSEKAAEYDARLRIGDVVTAQRYMRSMTTNTAGTEVATLSLDFTAPVAIGIAGQLANAADSIELIDWKVVLYRFPR